MPIVEVGMMGVRPNKTPMDPSTADGKILSDAWKAVIQAPGGPQRVFWGLEEEDRGRIWGWFDWESVEEHEAFAKSVGGEATKRFVEVFTPGFTKHAHVDTSVLKAPVTEVMLASFPPDITQDAKDAVAGQFQTFKEKALDQCKDVRTVSSGWGLEIDFPVRNSPNGEKGTLFFALIGWGSVDEHMAFRETEAFKENVGLITGMEGYVKLDMFHLSCEVMERED
ncbi:hypothetical protein BU25DRAFT_425074 [Macroventuria anomochaeta]|uniref:Uncharacterized protein n=1 Tax=Macroventuria anomochaeta TaxID=301207 RepID=A0ACB6RNF8_9PLEO|nr:uncharacterized protein BU25DRAFT_425074 [Macroventuria anomochaeta]KAF2623314.1 hypothetical protein BU25DRAFT_425074 [Macroventuria anomochaeta]